MRKHFKLAIAAPIVALALAVFSLAYASVPQAAAHDHDDDEGARVKLTFDQSLVVTHAFFGTVRGDFRGDLTTEILKRSPVIGRSVRVECDWIVVAEERSFIARLNGRFNTQSEEVEMEGVVTQGFLQGERVRVTGKLVDLNKLRFRGKLLIAPRHRDRD